MIVKLSLGGLALALLAACGLYVMKDRVSRQERELARQQTLVAAEQGQLAPPARGVGDARAARAGSHGSPPSISIWPRRIRGRS